LYSILKILEKFSVFDFSSLTLQIFYFSSYLLYKTWINFFQIINVGMIGVTKEEVL